VKINVEGKININGKIVVNGREYTSVEEMPADVRRLYGQAMARASRADHATGESGVKAKIVFDGREYLNVDTMPEDVRRLYETAMDAVKSERQAQAGGAPLAPGAGSSPPLPSMSPIGVGGGPASPGTKIWAVAFVVLGILGVLYFLLRVR
jgi:hypothetical protein